MQECGKGKRGRRELLKKRRGKNASFILRVGFADETISNAITDMAGGERGKGC
jgi:hypothetical protein